MLQFADPWLAVVAPLPILVWLLLPPYREQVESVHVPLFDQVASAAGLSPGPSAVVLSRSWLQWLIAPAAWVLIVAALMRPEWVEPPITKVVPTRDLLVAIDVSQSMETVDFRDPQGHLARRLDGVKSVLRDFIARRPGDRIGLILFGLSAHLQAPLTLDHDVVLTLLDEAAIGMAGPQTMLGEAIGLGITAFEKSRTPHRVLILMTDGNDTGSRMPPARAADIAAERGVTIHTIVVGDPRAEGEKVDMGAMQDVSARAHGRAFLATDKAALEGVYRELDSIEPARAESQSYRPKTPLFWIPLAGALGLLLAFYAVMLVTTLAGRIAAPAPQ
jgi:Ca-activated chloride channel family protein